MKKRAVMLLAIVMLAGLLALAPQDASAGAYGCDYASLGRLCFGVAGRGTHIWFFNLHREKVSYEGICEYRPEIQVFDEWGNHFVTVPFPTTMRCSPVAVYQEYNVDFWLPDRSKICLFWYERDQFQGSVCHGVKK